MSSETPITKNDKSDKPTPPMAQKSTSGEQYIRLPKPNLTQVIRKGL